MRLKARADDVPSLEELARVAHFSPFHFHRLFKTLVGESVAAYVRRLALQKAAQQVSYSRDAITRIAMDAGYESPEAFTRAIRANTLPPRYSRGYAA